MCRILALPQPRSYTFYNLHVYIVLLNPFTSISHLILTTSLWGRQVRNCYLAPILLMRKLVQRGKLNCLLSVTKSRLTSSGVGSIHFPLGHLSHIWSLSISGEVWEKQLACIFLLFCVSAAHPLFSLRTWKKIQVTKRQVLDMDFYQFRVCTLLSSVPNFWC